MSFRPHECGSEADRSAAAEAAIWHPFTQMKDCRTLPPLQIVRARGAKLFDRSGNYYYDTISSWWCNTLGHNHPRLNAALRRQLRCFEHVLFAGCTHRPAQELTERLLEILPEGLSRVFFSDNGSTSVEVALKMSLQYWHNRGQLQRTRFIGLDHGYHGDTVGAMSVSGRSVFNRVFTPLLFAAASVPAPYCYRCPLQQRYPDCGLACSDVLERQLKEQAPQTCALILEPLVLAAGGMIVYPPEYLRRAAALCRKYDVHLILDEVATGFGRTGTMFACEQAPVCPDFLCLSKGITAGYLPLGVTVTTESVYREFYADYAEQKTFFHGHTYTANPLACSVAAEALTIYRQERILDRVRELSAVLQPLMADFTDLPYAGDVRGIGVIAAVELVADKAAKQPFPAAQRLGYRIYQEGLRHHLLLRPLGNVVYFFLPYCLRPRELRRILTITGRILRAIPY